MSNIDTSAILRLLQELVFAAIFFYSSYWAFIIRRASAVPLYRNQALGLFLIAAFQGAVGLAFALTGGAGNLVIVFLDAMTNIFVFYWIDVSLSVARRSDPLLRDTFRWSTLRKVIWPLNIAGLLLVPFVFPLVFIQAFLIYAIGALLVSWAGRRSGDSTIRKHLKWFGSYAAFTVIFFVALSLVVTGIVSTDSALGLASFFVLFGVTLGGGYSLYRSATSLVPMRSLPEGVHLQQANPVS